jgi:signal transduction histidine kinase
VEITIADSGPGIPSEHAARIFERFYRAEEARAEHSNGAGLGLAIAKWAVEANGGEIGVREAVSGGARIWIRLVAA